MPRGPWPLLPQLLRRPAAGPDADPVPDAELLRRFADAHDQAAFELLVWRHGALVLAACRRVLRDGHAAEDAFQATFLVLARKAGSVRANLPAWLHRVARRAALRRAKVRPTEPLAADPPARPHVAADADLAAALDAEIDRLPDRFRLPVVLCYLDGRSTDDAAKALGVPRGTVLSRLATARQRLAARLTRRGITAPAAGLAAVAAADPVTAEVVQPCAAAAVRFASGTTVGTLPAIELAQGVLRMGTRITIATWAAVVLTTAGLGTGVAVVAGGGADPKPTAAQPAPKPPAAVPVAEKPDRKDWLPATVRRLSDEKAQLDARAEVIQHQLAERNADQLNPHVAKAMGEVLTQIELSIFETQTGILNNEPGLASLRAKLAAVEAKPLSSYGTAFSAAGMMGMPGGDMGGYPGGPPGAYPPGSAMMGGPGMPGTPPGLAEKQARLQQKEADVARMTAVSKADSPALRTARAELAKLRAEYEAETAKANEAYQKSQKDQEKQRVAADIQSAEAAHQAKVRALDTLKKQRDETVARLTKADRTQHDAAVRRLTDELALLREQSNQVARTIMTLELEEAKGVLAGPPAAADDKLDRILRELADLKAEVRKLSAERK